MALVGDVILASDSASFVLTFGPKLGLIPDLGSTWSLPRLVGRAKALKVSLFRRPIRKIRHSYRYLWELLILFTRRLENHQPLHPLVFVIGSKMEAGVGLCATLVPYPSLNCSPQQSLQMRIFLQGVDWTCQDLNYLLTAFPRLLFRPTIKWNFLAHLAWCGKVLP